MRLNRIFQNIDLKEQNIIELDSDASKHILQVLRMRMDEPLIIFNGKGGEYSGKIAEITKNRLKVKILSFDPIERESPLDIHLAQCVSRGDKMDFTIQKAVELGVNKITPIISERCGVKLAEDRWEKKQTHWEKIIISSCEQCGRNTIPKLYPVENFGDCPPKGDSPQKGTVPFRLILDHHADKKLSDISLTDRSIILLIGPEGGFTENEIDFANQTGFVSVTLGPRILRTETAGIAAISVLQTKFGDF